MFANKNHSIANPLAGALAGPKPPPTPRPPASAPPKPPSTPPVPAGGAGAGPSSPAPKAGASVGASPVNCNKDVLLSTRSIEIDRETYKIWLKDPDYAPYMYIRIGLLEPEGKALYYCADLTDFTGDPNSIVRNGKTIPVEDSVNIRFYIKETKWNEHVEKYKLLEKKRQLLEKQRELEGILRKESFSAEDVNNLSSWHGINLQTLPQKKFVKYIAETKILNGKEFLRLERAGLVKRDDYSLTTEYYEDNGRPAVKHTYTKISASASAIGGKRRSKRTRHRKGKKPVASRKKRRRG
jgi:hypothetical protein